MYKHRFGAAYTRSYATGYFTFDTTVEWGKYGPLFQKNSHVCNTFTCFGCWEHKTLGYFIRDTQRQDYKRHILLCCGCWDALNERVTDWWTMPLYEV